MDHNISQENNIHCTLLYEVQIFVISLENEKIGRNEKLSVLCSLSNSDQYRFPYGMVSVDHQGRDWELYASMYKLESYGD